MPSERGSEADFATATTHAKIYRPCPRPSGSCRSSHVETCWASADVSGLRNTVAGLKHVVLLAKQYKRITEQNARPQMRLTCRACAGMGLGKIQTEIHVTG